MRLKTVLINACRSRFISFRKTRSPIAASFYGGRNGQRKDYAPAGEEVPYAMTVEIEDFKDSGKSLHIQALILVEREGQKRIVIGNKGSRLKLIGQQARLDMEQMFDRKVMLKLWVKVKSGWSDDERVLRSLGYNDFDCNYYPCVLNHSQPIFFIPEITAIVV